MIISASLMVGLTNFHSQNDKILSLENLISISSAQAESGGQEPYVQCCVPCPGGVKYFCAMVGWEGCFTWPCGGGYC